MKSLYGSSEAKGQIGAFSDALSVFTREDDPIRRARAELKLSSLLADVEPPRLDEALAAVLGAQLVFDPGHDPEQYVASCGHASRLRQKLAKSIDDPAKKWAVQSRSLRDLLLGEHTAATHLKRSGRCSHELGQLIEDIKMSICEAERPRADEEVAQLRREVTRP